MTAPATEQVDLSAVERDIAKVLVAHGLAGHDTIQVAVYPIIQGGRTAGVSITGMAYTRPAGLPTEQPATAPFTEMADEMEAVS